jgi:ferric iron reductase protein FhuF
MGEGNTAARVLYALHVTRNAMVQRTSQFRRRRTVHACIMATKKHPVTRQSALRFETLYRRMCTVRRRFAVPNQKLRASAAHRDDELVGLLGKRFAFL